MNHNHFEKTIQTTLEGVKALYAQLEKQGEAWDAKKEEEKRHMGAERIMEEYYALMEFEEMLNKLGDHFMVMINKEIPRITQGSVQDSIIIERLKAVVLQLMRASRGVSEESASKFLDELVTRQAPFLPSASVQTTKPFVSVISPPYQIKKEAKEDTSEANITKEDTTKKGHDQKEKGEKGEKENENKPGNRMMIHSQNGIIFLDSNGYFLMREKHILYKNYLNVGKMYRSLFLSLSEFINEMESITPEVLGALKTIHIKHRNHSFL